MSNKKIILATGSDENYIQHIERYLYSMKENSNFDENILVYVGDDIEKIKKYEKVRNCELRIENIKSLNQNKCLQHGEFLKSSYFNEINDEDIIFFTDGDIYLQRNMNPEEILFLKNMKDDDVWVGYNAGPNDTLADEFSRVS